MVFLRFSSDFVISLVINANIPIRMHKFYNICVLVNLHCYVVIQYKYINILHLLNRQLKAVNGQNRS